MKPKLKGLFLFLALAPLALMAALAWRMAREEEAALRNRLVNLMENQMADHAAEALELLKEHERALLPRIDRVASDRSALKRAFPFVSHFFLIDRDGALVYPDPAGNLSVQEWEFLRRAESVLQDGVFLPGEEDGDSRYQQKAAPSARHGWHRWYFNEGMQLLFWTRLANGAIAGAELNRSRFLADLIARLPETPKREDAPLRMALVDSMDHTLYQWGRYQPREGAPPLAIHTLAEPLSGWAIQCWLPDDLLTGPAGSTLGITIWLTTAAAGLVFLVAAFVFYREHSREMRTAAQRVQFVNQVSHELKTPLTNIRLYAELLREQQDEENAKGMRQLDIIIEEAQRLARLIGNILSFSRSARGKLTLNKASTSPDEVVNHILDRFHPAMERQGIDLTFHPGAPETRQLDTEALEQILGNLLSNIEKYAAAGGQARVETRAEGAMLLLTVQDAGPGIPDAQKERVFAPFHRLNDSLTEGVSGTGIGLAIARDLARLHGGDLILRPSERGACFEARLKAPTTGDTP